MREAWVLWVGVMAAALAGCSSGLRFEPAGTGEGLVVRGDAIFRPGPGERSYEDDQGRHARRAASAPDADGRWTVTVRIEGRAIDGVHVLERREDGSVALVSMTGPRHDAPEEAQIVRFDPPLVLMPRMLEWGGTLESEASLTTQPRDGGRMRHGQATAETTLVGTDDQGRALVRTLIRFAIGPARVTRETVRTLGPEGGIAAEQTALTVRVFGFAIHRGHEAFRLSDG